MERSTAGVDSKSTVKSLQGLAPRCSTRLAIIQRPFAFGFCLSLSNPSLESQCCIDTLQGWFPSVRQAATRTLPLS